MGNVHACDEHCDVPDPPADMEHDDGLVSFCGPGWVKKQETTWTWCLEIRGPRTDSFYFADQRGKKVATLPTASQQGLLSYHDMNKIRFCKGETMEELFSIERFDLAMAKTIHLTGKRMVVATIRGSTFTDEKRMFAGEEDFDWRNEPTSGNEPMLFFGADDSNMPKSEWTEGSRTILEDSVGRVVAWWQRAPQLAKREVDFSEQVWKELKEYMVQVQPGTDVALVLAAVSVAVWF
eukprot:TRINITY_DN44486_c0_g1_i1.p1 TRINITY_DN44486_c0_g1~~TRINITY_DN44486_c0_g1_i1.p1  ORF type:complete len:236 (+),score=34.11 TRINITY_DN44486_c0_g1_i1:35-742(+)